MSSTHVYDGRSSGRDPVRDHGGILRRSTATELIGENTDRQRNRKRDALREVKEVRSIAAGALATGRMPDSDIRTLAERRAELLGQSIDELHAGYTVPGLLVWLNLQLIPLQARPFRFEGDRPEGDQLRGFMARARCPLWWRRQLRRAAVRARETEANLAGEVCAVRRQPYITHDTAHRHALRRAANAAMMAATELENDAGQIMTLLDLAATTTSNKGIRRGELMTRISGCERLAEEFGQRGVFLTLTAPSRFHAVHRHGGKNRSHTGATPRDAQQWLCATWAKARAKLQRMGLAPFGFRVAEPHHDGCPHWHALIFSKPGELWRVVLAIKRQWLKDIDPRPMGVIHAHGCREGKGGQIPLFLRAGTGGAMRPVHALHCSRPGTGRVREPIFSTERGARKYRVKAILMRPGEAAAYMAKYIAKNIDDAGAVGSEGHLDDDYSDAVPKPAQKDAFGGTAQRVEAWASAWGIRQFQAIGQPPVTVWRELRRVDEQARQGATRRLRVAFDAVNRDGERRADWALYVVAQGGLWTGRKYLLRIASMVESRVGRYETTEQARPCGVVDSTGPGDWHMSNRREWRPRGEWRKTSAPSAPVNPCALYAMSPAGYEPNPKHAAWEVGQLAAAERKKEARAYDVQEARAFAAQRAALHPWTRVNNCTRRQLPDLMSSGIVGVVRDELRRFREARRGPGP